jgi:hypothetical protein
MIYICSKCFVDVLRAMMIKEILRIIVFAIYNLLYAMPCC